MKQFIILLAIIFYGYKGIARAFWLMFPLIFLVCTIQESKIIYSDLFLPFFITGTGVFYFLYLRLLNKIESGLAKVKYEKK